MRPSFLKFLNFQKQSKLSPQKIEDLHTILFMSPLKQKIDSDKLKRKLDLPNNNAKKLFTDLINTGVLDIVSINCTECGETIKKFLNTCPTCDSEINIEEYYTDINALLANEKIKLIKSKHHESKKADIIAREWDVQKYLSYVLIDLVDSENVQNILGDQDYKDFFQEIREILKYHALSSIKGEYLILGEIGDCIKIAFTKKDDVITFFKGFSNELANRVNTSSLILKYLTQLEYFPKFSGIVDILELPSTTNGYISPKSIISITLDGSIDFNSKALTGLFRLDSGVHINNDKAFSANNVSLWLSENYISNTKFKFLNKIEVEVGKHESLKVKRNVALLLFNKGKENEIENPEKYKRENKLIGSN